MRAGMMYVTSRFDGHHVYYMCSHYACYICSEVMNYRYLPLDDIPAIEGLMDVENHERMSLELG